MTVSVIRNKNSILKRCHGLTSSKFVLSAVEATIARVEPAKLISTAVNRKQGRLIVSGIRHEKMTFDLTRYDKIYIVGAGKASVPMAVGLVEALHVGKAKSLKVSGSIITPYGTSRIPDIDVIEAGHPLPDANGIKGTKKIVNILRRAKPTDLIFVLLSGGGSALLSLPIRGITLDDKRHVTQSLLASGDFNPRFEIYRTNAPITGKGWEVDPIFSTINYLFDSYNFRRNR